MVPLAKWLYLDKIGCIWAKGFIWINLMVACIWYKIVVYLGKMVVLEWANNGCYFRCKLVVFGQNGCIWAKLVVFYLSGWICGKCLYLGKMISCIWAKWL